MFCAKCGQAIVPGARFCRSCGQPLQAVPPQPIGAPPPPAFPPVSSPPLAAVGSARAGTETAAAAEKPRSARGIMGRIFAILVGILLMVFGGRTLILVVAGSDASAVVTGISRSTSRQSRNARNPAASRNNFVVNYRFTTAGGSSIEGGIGRNNVFDQTKLPPFGSLLRVHYLKPIPYLNAPEDEFPSWLDLILIAVGILMVSGIGKFQKAARGILGFKRR